MKRIAFLVLTFVFATAAFGADGTVQWARRVELGLGASGAIKTVAAEAGARVAKGQVLVALDDTPFKAELDQARADRDEAARDYKQAKQLFELKALSTVELENAKLKSVRAQARYAQAQYQFDRSRIVAPFDAWVLEVRAQAGQNVVNALEARPLVVLAAAGEYVARTRVPGSALERLAPGAAATVTVAGKSYAGKVRALALEPSKGDEHDVTIAFNAAERLRPGQPAKVEFGGS
jgi:RND family efflux transporter MFP subunit